MFQTKFVQKIKTHVLCSVTLFFFENRAVYEIMWKNYSRGREANVLQRKRLESWMPKATETHSEYVKLLFHDNNGYANVFHCKVIRTLRVTLR